MAERIADDAGAFPVELIFQGSFDCGSGFDATSNHFIGVIDVDVDGDRRTAIRFRAANVAFGEFSGWQGQPMRLRVGTTLANAAFPMAIRSARVS